jgi:hypothetical protein
MDDKVANSLGGRSRARRQPAMRPSFVVEALQTAQRTLGLNGVESPSRAPRCTKSQMASDSDLFDKINSASQNGGFSGTVDAFES